MLEIRHVMILIWCAASMMILNEIEVRESFSEGIIALITYFLRL